MSSGRRKFLKGLGAIALLPVLPALAHSSNSAHSTDGAKSTDGDRSTQAASHRILCCNIRVALDEDEAKGLGWSARRDICLKVIKDKKPDIISLQEVLKVQADDFRKAFPSYQLFGFDGPEMDPHPTVMN
jgi:hypothetical protein